MNEERQGEEKVAGIEKEEAEEEKKRVLLESAIEMVAKIPPETLTAEPEELIQRLSSIEFARQVLGPEILRRPDWPVLWCRLICWIRYIVCVLRCPPFLRDVLIRSVGRVDSVSPLNKTSKLIADLATGEETPVGGRISISGSSNISGAGRKIQKYSLWYAEYDTVLDKWVDAPPDHTPLPAGWLGPLMPPIEYVSPHEHTWNCGPFSGSNIVSNGDLTKKWEKSTCPFPPPPEYWWLKLSRWDTNAINGRFTMLLMVEDNLGGIYYDGQRVWIDNQPITGYIDGIKPLKPCEELRLSLGKVSIMGEAYDPPIDASITPISPPNDNFNYYQLWFRKQGAPAYQEIPPGKINTQVGPGVGVLVDWDTTMLDKSIGSGLGIPPNQLLERGESCAYNIRLYVCDKTHVSDTATPHYQWDHYPICVLNDLPKEEKEEARPEG